MATKEQLQHLKANSRAFEDLTNSSVDDYFADYAYIPDLYERVCDHLGLKPIRSPQIWLHGQPARTLEEVIKYLSGDAHDRSKVQFFDGKEFHDLILRKDS